MDHPRRSIFVCLLLVCFASPVAAGPGTVGSGDDSSQVSDGILSGGLLAAISSGLLWPAPLDGTVSPAAAPPGTGFPEGIWDLDHLPSSIGRHSHTLIYDPLRDRLIAFGGADNNTNDLYNAYNDLWELSLADPQGWNSVATVGIPPPPRVFHSAIYDPVRDRMIVFGGTATPNNYMNDLWELSLSGVPTWTRLTPPTPRPTRRAFHTAIYDPVGDRMIVHGGVDLTSYLKDTWSLDLAGPPVWRSLAITGPRVYGHSAIHDPIGRRMVLYGGWGANGYPNNDVWSFSLDTRFWTKPVIPRPLPPIPYGHVAVCEPRGQRLLLWQMAWPDYVTGTWSLSLSGPPAWAQMRTQGGLSPRYFYGSVYDPRRHRLIVHGGQFQSATGETRVLSMPMPIAIDVKPGSDENVISLRSHGLVRVAVLGSETLDASAIDPAGIVFAGAAVARLPNGSPITQIQDVNADGRPDLVCSFHVDALAILPDDTTAVLTARLPGGGLGIGSDHIRPVPPGGTGNTFSESAAVPPGEFSLTALRAGQGGQLAVELVLPVTGPALLELMDISGRRWVSRSLDAGAGRHRVQLAEAGTLPAGVYLVRAAQGSRRAIAKMLVIR